MSSHAPSTLLFFFLMIRRPPRSTPLSLHDALPIYYIRELERLYVPWSERTGKHWLGSFTTTFRFNEVDRKSTRLNSSHQIISYAVFCLKKKNQATPPHTPHSTPTPTLTSPHHTRPV